MTEYLDFPTMDKVNMTRRGSEPFMQQCILMREKDYGHELLTALDEFRTASMFTDVVLCVREYDRLYEFPCHRSVLAASSAYFRAMFSTNLKEGNEHHTDIFEVSADILEAIIDYAYKGEIKISIDNAEVSITLLVSFKI